MANLGGVSGDLSEHRGSEIPLLGITSLNRHFYAQIDWTSRCGRKMLFTRKSDRQIVQNKQIYLLLFNEQNYPTILRFELH